MHPFEMHLLSSQSFVILVIGLGLCFFPEQLKFPPLFLGQIY